MGVFQLGCVMSRLFLFLLLGLSLQGCVVLDTVNTGAKVAGAGARVVSSTGDVIFDHDGDGR
jgi:hypothetical protein